MYLIASLILLAIILVARVANKWRLPLVVISLFAGILFGSDVTGLIYFDNFALSRQIADFSLVFILFIGGFGTKKERLRSVLAPSMVLSTLGVIITAGVTGLLMHLFLKLNLSTSILIGCIIASTDAAAVFSILRSRTLNKKLSSVIEIESATNDPMAIVLTSIAVQLIVAQLQHPLRIGFTLFWQISGGILIGLLVGKAASFLFKYIKTLDKGYFYIYMIAIIMFSYGASDLCHASGVLSAFFAGYLLGNSDIPYKSTISTLLEALSTIANVIVFVLLGLLVFPHEFRYVYLDGIILFLILVLFARPVAVFCCTFFTKYTIKEKIFLSWSGLRGAVPIVLATYPAADGVADSRTIFNIVFFAVLLSVVVQGTSITRLADLLKLAVKAKPKPKQVMELVTLQTSQLELIELNIDDDDYCGTALISSLNLPAAATITMVNRHDTIIAPRGDTEIRAGDVLFVLVQTSQIDNVTSGILKNFQTKNKEHGANK
ncbi:MAG TPA: potassium/proton antiporter [Chitinispirillaceae bacterium]|nr:potassium/proton antiporter [Chitinispirillaceae bacterium]